MARKIQKPAFDEGPYVHDLISRIVRECPRRQPTSADEKKGQEIVAAEFAELGLASSWQPFKFNDNLYKNVALHFGLGTLGTAISPVAPLAALGLHLLAAGSYWADSTRKAYILRRLLGFKPSQNLLAVAPAAGVPRLRVVITAHIDAAFTGLVFDPWFIKHFSSEPPKGLEFLKRGLALATAGQAALAGFDLLRCVFGPILTLPLRPIEHVLSLPGALSLLMTLEAVARDTIVPGANDDLSGVAALPLLARRLLADKPDDVELVFAVTGCEEASLGGGDALARQMEGVWDKANTVVVGLDSLSMGDLKFLELEGEVTRVRAPAWLVDTARGVAASEPRFAEVEGFAVPVGGSDIAAFLYHGWDGLCLTCVDPGIGAPVHYHTVQDSPENLDVAKVLYSVDFTEKFVRAIIDRRR